MESLSPTPAVSSLRMLLSAAAVKGGALQYLDVEQAFIRAEADEEIYIKLPLKYQASLGTVGKLNKASYSLRSPDRVLLEHQSHRFPQDAETRAVINRSLRVRKGCGWTSEKRGRPAFSCPAFVTRPLRISWRAWAHSSNSAPRQGELLE